MDGPNISQMRRSSSDLDMRTRLAQTQSLRQCMMVYVTPYEGCEGSLFESHIDTFQCSIIYAHWTLTKAGFHFMYRKQNRSALNISLLFRETKLTPSALK